MHNSTITADKFGDWIQAVQTAAHALVGAYDAFDRSPINFDLVTFNWADRFLMREDLKVTARALVRAAAEEIAGIAARIEKEAV